MNIKTLVSGLAMTAAIAMSGPVFAQTMVGGMSVSAADLPSVQERCNMLSTAADTPKSLTNTSNDNGSAPDEKANQPTKDGTDHSSTSATPPAADATAQATTTLDLDAITLENCTAAGLVK